MPSFRLFDFLLFILITSLLTILLPTFVSDNSFRKNYFVAALRSATQNITESKSSSLTISRSPSRTVTPARPQPPPIIALVSALAVPALCMLSSNSIAGQTCRFVVFNITYDGFMFDSNLIGLNMRTRNLKPQPCQRPCPYGFPSLFSHFADGVTAKSNVTHLTVQLPVMPTLDPAGQVELLFDWWARMPTLRGTPSQNPTSSIYITPVSSVAAQSSVLSVAQGMSAVLSYLSALSNSNPAVYDAQITAIIAASECVHPGVQLTAAPGLRMLRPTVYGVLGASGIVTGMWHNLVLSIIFSSLHLFGASIARMRAVTWLRAMSRTFFPALSYQLACVLSVGMLNSAIVVLAGYYDSEIEVNAGMKVIAVLIILIVFALGIVPLVFRRELFTAVARSHDVASYEFPPMVRRLLAGSSWGPDESANRWILPFGACRAGLGHFATMSYLYTLGQVIIFSIIPSNPGGCAGQAAAGIVWIIVFAFLLIKYRPYRSVADTALSTVSAVAVIAPLVFTIVRASALSEMDAGVNAVTLFAFSHFLVSFRAVIAMVAFVVERRFLRPHVWADSIAALSEHDAATLGAGRSEADQAKKLRSEGLAAQDLKELRDANEAGGAQDQELLQELLIKQEQHRHELLRQSQRGKNMSDEERRSFLFFGVPEPVGMSVTEHLAIEAKKKTTRDVDGRLISNGGGGAADAGLGGDSHMHRLMRADGAMPPTLKKRMEVQYKLL